MQLFDQHKRSVFEEFTQLIEGFKAEEERAAKEREE